MTDETRKVIQNLIDAEILDLNDVLDHDELETAIAQTLRSEPLTDEEDEWRLVIVSRTDKGITAYRWETQVERNQTSDVDDQEWETIDCGSWELLESAAVADSETVEV